jgi:site-specific recombinase XerD
MRQDMQIRNFSPSTIQTYLYHVRCFAQYFGKSPERLGPQHVRDYQLHLVENKKASWSSFNQAVCALRFLYRFTLRRKWHVTMIPFAKKPKILPSVLGPEEVRRLLTCTHPLKHRTIVTTLYGAGLRLEEALHLRLSDIDSARMLLRVACGKGCKERCVPFSPRLLDALREYWKKYRPAHWLFPGRKPEKPLSASAVQRSCERAVREAGIHKRVTPHTLRHSYATGLLEAGVDLLTISKLLGHRSFSSTLIYLHVRRPHLESVPSPLDWLPLDQCPKSVSPDTNATNSTPTTATPSTPPAATTSTTPTEPTQPTPPPTSAASTTPFTPTTATSPPSHPGTPRSADHDRSSAESGARRISGKNTSPTAKPSASSSNDADSGSPGKPKPTSKESRKKSRSSKRRD